MAKKVEKEVSTVVAQEATKVVETGRKRNPDYEKAMAEVAKYVNDVAEDDGTEFYVDHKAKVVVCRREKVYIAEFENEDGEFIEGEMAEVQYGLSKCCPSDRFNVLLGKYIALKRARNRPIPNFIRSVIFGK